MTDEPRRVLVVENDPLVAESLAECLSARGFDATWTMSAVKSLELLERATRPAAAIGSDNAPVDQPAPFAVAVIDMALSGMSGLELIAAMRDRGLDTVPIAITAYGTIESAVETIRLGAVDYLIKPVVDDELEIAVERAHRQYVLVAENSNLRRQLEDRFGFDSIVGRDPRMRRIFDSIRAVAPSRTTVLMTGESGTGKSLIARAIHRHSSRAKGPFIEISCGSIPETLLESELFGHTRGAFTGAHTGKKGRFLAAHTGTIFLDEINSASPGMQLKLLRVLQERRFEPVGATETIEVDVRILLASNEPLERLVTDGIFRQDLYYRVNVLSIDVPPLRERASDIVPLSEHFLEMLARDAGKQLVGFTDEALDALRSYTWPGNVRELQNVIERAVVLSRSPRIQVADLPDHVIDNRAPLGRAMDAADAALRLDDWRPMSLAEALREPERRILLAALNANEWNRQRTAEMLEINRSTLYKKMKQYGLDEYGETG